MKHFLIFSLFLLGQINISQAQKEITLEEIFLKGTFQTKNVPGFNYLKDGKSYVVQNEKGIQSYLIKDGQLVSELLNNTEFRGAVDETKRIENFTLSPDETKMLISMDNRNIYRHSQKGIFYVYDIVKKIFTPIFDKKTISNTTFNNQGDKVAFSYENDLYTFDLITLKSNRITFDGEWNKIINGMCDWVNEEEFGLTKAFDWSPDGKNIAFLKFDESAVKEVIINYNKDENYPTFHSFKYPKVGEDNATVSLMIYDLISKKVTPIENFQDKNIYYPRIKWTADPNKLSYFKMNRHQNDLKINIYDKTSNKISTLLNETNDRYIDINDFLYFFKDNKKFLWVSEKGGFNQIYLYDMNGKQLKRISDGKYDISDIYGIDEKNNKIYYQQISPTPMDRQVISSDFAKNVNAILTPISGTSSILFSPSFEYGLYKYSNVNTPPIFKLIDKNFKPIKTLEENQIAQERFQQYPTLNTSFFSFNTSENVQLNGWMIKPNNFNSSKKYPVLMFLYGGPGSQQVLDKWGGGQAYWFKMLAEKGYIIACVDNRGTGGRGEEFKKLTYLQLGHFETIDQIEAAKFLGNQSYIDKSRIGIFGWSYGGYMSSLCLLKGNDVFKSALSVAPVTNWKWYDSIYTERYMRTEQENPKGYHDNSPVYFADRLKGNYFIAHGEADDNVHYQNTSEMMKNLIKNNKSFESHIYPNSNHGIYTDGATIHLYNQMTNFIYNKI